MFDLRALLRLAQAAIALSACLTLAAPAVATEPDTYIRDIQISASGARLEILILMSEQPTAATANITTDGVALTFSGVALAPFDVKPPDRGLVSQAVGHDDNITIQSAELRSASTVLYRRSVLLVGELSTPVAVATTQAAAPVRSVAKSVEPTPKRTMFSPRDAAGLSNASCQTAAASHAADSWDLKALGDHVLCLISEGDLTTAEPMTQQLESFAPDDWRAPFARAELLRGHNASMSEIAYRNAIALCDAPDGRAVITHRLASLLSSHPDH